MNHQPNSIIAAARYANTAHYGQKRKWDDEDYINHPLRVANIVMLHPKSNPDMVVSALLHDTVEDCEIKTEDIAASFGDHVASIVYGLTNPSQMDPEWPNVPRSERKQMDLDHISRQPDEVKLIKLADRLDNVQNLKVAPKKWVRKYIIETRNLIEAIGYVSPELSGQIQDKIDDFGVYTPVR